MWNGLRVSYGRLSPGEAVDGYLVRHVVSFDVGGSGWRAYDWLGLGRMGGTAPPLAINVLPALVRYSASWRPGPETVVVELSTAFVTAVAARMCAGSELRPAAGVEDPFVSHICLALVEEARAGAPGGALAAEGLAVPLVAHLLRGAGAPPRRVVASPPALSPAIVRQVLEHVRRHPDASLSLRDLAAVARMDVYRFARAFKKATGMSPHRYVTAARIDLAKALLLDPTISISEIALRAGFGTPSHFAVTFRRVTGVTPRAHRNAAAGRA